MTRINDFYIFDKEIVRPWNPTQLTFIIKRELKQNVQCHRIFTRAKRIVHDIYKMTIFITQAYLYTTLHCVGCEFI